MYSHFDVIIIGGRCAGASLAIRLARHNLRVLIVDRAEFPSLPAVASTPLIHPGTMRLMDELNIPEEAYAHPDSLIENYATVCGPYFMTVMPTSRMGIDRNYFYGGDRVRFDNALWSELEKYPTITARAGFSATGILRNEHGKACGVTGKAHGGEKETFTADLIIGADGRYSFTARELGARVVEEHNEHISASYHAEWENVGEFSPRHKHTFTLYNNLQGVLSLFIPIATHKHIVTTFIRADLAHFGAHNAERAYLDLLQKNFPHAWNRLKNARRVTPVMGIKRIENGYREAYGDGWALVGDALHYKDPVDGQGIYDALLEAKILAEVIVDWKREGGCWCAAGEVYRQRVLDGTHEMFEETLKNVERRFYFPPPSALEAQTKLRWILTDPAYQSYIFRYLSRALRPGEQPPSNKRVIVNGIIRDLTGLTPF